MLIIYTYILTTSIYTVLGLNSYINIMTVVDGSSLVF